MDELNELYQEMILDHNRNPRNFGKMDNATVQSEGFNPLCGDHYHIYLILDGDIIREAGFEGKGCAISKASASIMTDLVKGKTTAEAGQMFSDFQRLVKGEMEPSDTKQEKIGVFAGVREFPMRVKCASLAWHTLQAALTKKEGTVSTED